LDLDLLLFDREIRATENFTLPHPRARDRLFVLAPAHEVAPAAVWPDVVPANEKTTSQLLAELKTDEHVVRLDPDS
jgi:2-amino-4-hydroxy-6-hydroxymethyldihydropteridine diphosphokinase